MEVSPCTKPDFDEILTLLPEFWGSDRTAHLHHPMFLYEFGNSSFVVRDKGEVVAYLFGFMSQTESTGYVHLVAVRSSHRKMGLGRLLYRRFAAFARSRGARRVKAITSPENRDSVEFHRKLGMLPLGSAEGFPIPVAKDYGGPGKHMVVFGCDLGEETDSP